MLLLCECRRIKIKTQVRGSHRESGKMQAENHPRNEGRDGGGLARVVVQTGLTHSLSQ